MTENQLGIGGQNVIPKVLHFVKFSIFESIQEVAGKMPLIWCGSLGSCFNSLLMQKLKIELSLGFDDLASFNLQRFVGFFCMGVGESIMDIRNHF